MAAAAVPTRRPPDRPLPSAKSSSIAARMKGLLRGLRHLSTFFEAKEEREMQIGYPTDVKHVAHIGWDGAALNSPSWMSQFRVAVEAPPAAPAASAMAAEGPPPPRRTPRRRKQPAGGGGSPKRANKGGEEAPAAVRRKKDGRRGSSSSKAAKSTVLVAPAGGGETTTVDSLLLLLPQPLALAKG